MKTIGIFCSGKNSLKQEYIDISKILISSIDPKKFAIAYGGGTTGIMGYVRNSFLEKGGKVISSNLYRFQEPEIEDDYIFEKISDRQAKLIEISDIFLVLPGGIGTLFETMQVLTGNYIGEGFKEIIFFNYNGLYDLCLEQMSVLQREGFLKYNLEQLQMKIFTNYDDILNYLNSREQ